MPEPLDPISETPWHRPGVVIPWRPPGAGLFPGAGLATTPGTPIGTLRTPSPAVHAGVGLLLLVAAAGLSVFKPRGTTGYGRRR